MRSPVHARRGRLYTDRKMGYAGIIDVTEHWPIELGNRHVVTRHVSQHLIYGSKTVNRCNKHILKSKKHFVVDARVARPRASLCGWMRHARDLRAAMPTKSIVTSR